MKTVRLFIIVVEISIHIWSTTVADTDYREDTFINGTGVLNCTTQRQKIHIESVDYNASICSGTNGSIMQHFTNLCNGKSFCEFVVRETINDLNLTCLANETAANLFDIDYYCTQDGMWSAWSEYSSCSLTCVGGVQSRSRSCNDPAPSKYGQNCTGRNVEQIACNNINCSNPIVKTYIEGEHAHLTCSAEHKETMDIIDVNYHHGICSHSGTYGIRNVCNGKTNCSFDISNSNIGSSCGANGIATLDVKYNCIRNGGWSDWNTSASCPVTCGVALRNVTRTCSNPKPNANGDTCIGDDFDEQTCNTNNCIYQNTACLTEHVIWNCPDGHIIVNKAVWETNGTCGVGFTIYKSLNVIKTMKTACENRQNCTFIIANDHNFQVSCATSVSRCTLFDYVYTCIKATWDEWSLWSECSRSCDSGIKTRQRQCLNKMNTTDGYVSECVGDGTESRSCNTEVCPYCHKNNFQSTLLQYSSDVKADNSSGSGYLLLNGIYTITCCGRIRMWEFIPVNTGRLTFVIMRKTSDNKYKFVGYNQIHIPAKDLRKSTKFNVSEEKRIAITQGDIFGWFDSGSNIVGFNDCLPNNETCPLSYRLINDIREGDVIDIATLSRTSRRSYTMNYSISENRPLAFDLPSTPIIIPDHLHVDSLVMKVPICDRDYGDYIKDFKLDYDNEYFYFDTKLRNVYLQKALPHQGGQINTTLYMVLTVEDSCFNVANANFTITSFNVPPEVSGLRDELMIDLTKISNDSSFHIFNVADPSDDNISCGIKRTSDSADLFVLEMEDNDAYLRINNHTVLLSKSSLEYKLVIICDDGIDETIIKLTVDIVLTKNDDPNVQIDSDITHIVIIGVCAFISVLFVVLFILVLIRNCRRKRVMEDRSEIGINTYMSTIETTDEPNPYAELEHSFDKQKTNANVEMSVSSEH